jgi:hypothetical protein
MRIPAVSQDRRLCTSRAQAREHEWQPIHRSILGAVKIFMAHSYLQKGYYGIVETVCFIL